MHRPTIRELSNVIINAVRPEADHGRRDRVLIHATRCLHANEIWAIGDKLRKAGEVLTHLITFDSIFIPSRGRQSPKSSDSGGLLVLMIDRTVSRRTSLGLVKSGMLSCRWKSGRT